MKKTILLLSLLVLISCEKRSDIEKMLIDGKWVLFKGSTLRNEVDKWPNGYIKFHENGSFKNYTLEDEPEIYEQREYLKWEYISSNNKLIIKDHELKILSIEGDTIHMLRDTVDIMIYDIKKTQAILKKGPGRCLGG